MKLNCKLLIGKVDGRFNQLVHHVADSHINAYCRMKLALTEDNPTIKPYDEKLWAEMNDVQIIADQYFSYIIARVTRTMV
jgi:hypothetical protein